MNRFTTALLCGCALPALLSQMAAANPAGGQVAQGAASIGSSGNTLTVDQTTKIVIVNWNSFNIAAGETTRFNQPGSNATAVNRIGGADPAQILGNLSANGRVILIDGSGILFGPNAKVNAAALIATTSDAADADLMSGNANFNQPGNPNARIVNQGRITTTSGGMVGLIAPSVSNQGAIRARLGQVNLAGANVFTLDFTGDGLISFPVDPSVAAAALDNNGKPVKALVSNNGRIEGAIVTLTARAAAGLVENAISLKGKIVATAAHEVGGKIVLDAGQGNIALNGATLDASGKNGGGSITAGGWDASAISAGAMATIKTNATQSGDGGNVSLIAQNLQYAGTIQAQGGSASGNGGKVETSGSHANLNGARVSTAAPQGQAGNWLIDPTDFTVAASGGDMTGAQLTANLANGNVTIQSSQGASGTAGDININDAVSWSSHTLTLDAVNVINVNAVMSATGTAAFVGNTGATSVSGYGVINMALGETGFSGRLDLAPTASFTLNGTPYTILTTLGAQDGSGGGLSSVQDGNYVLGANIDASATSSWRGYNSGFMPIGIPSQPYQGNFNGLGHIVSNLTTYIIGGMFGVVSGGDISNIGVGGQIVYIYNGGGADGIGGLVGALYSGSITNSFSTMTVTGFDDVGGLVGISEGTIINSHADGSVTSVDTATGSFEAEAGGLVGQLNGGTIIASHASGAVSGAFAGGGLVGITLGGGTISQSYATGNATAAAAGGLLGYSYGPTIITQSYGTGSATGSTYAGGLVGVADYGLTVSESYALGAASGSSAAGGLIGFVDSSGASIDQVYASGKVTSSGAAGALVGSGSATITNSYWDSYGTGIGGTVTGASAVTSDPAQAAAANYAFTASAYGNFSTDWSLQNGLRPMGLWELPLVDGMGLISNAHQIEIINSNSTTLAGNYTLAYDLDLSGAVPGSDVWGPQGYIPVGSAGALFTGSLNGQGHTVSGLSISQSTGYAGLFGAIGATGSISNIALSGISLSAGASNVTLGALAGFSQGSISDVVVTGTVGGGSDTTVGGLIGQMNGGSISDSYSTAAVGDSGSAVAGGLVGVMNGGAITDSYTYVTGAVTVGSGSTVAGGLVGVMNGGAIANTYATGAVTGGSGATIGGLLGQAYGSSAVSSSFAAGAVTGGSSATLGGVVGDATSGTNFTNVYFDTDRTTLSSGIGAGSVTGGVTGLTTAQLRDGTTHDLNAPDWGVASGYDPYLTIQTSISQVQPSITIDAAMAAGTNAIMATGRSVFLTATAGDITVAAPLSLTASTLTASTLTLTASGNINFNAPVTVTGTADLVFSASDWSFAQGSSLSFPGVADGTTGRLTIDGFDMMLENDLPALASAISVSVGGGYALNANIDASGTTYTSAPLQTNETNNNVGFFDGLGHTVTGLTINSDHPFVGLFDYFSEGIVRDIGLIGGSVTGGSDTNYIGALVGAGNEILHSYVLGTTVTLNKSGSYSYVGGLVGQLIFGTDDYATGAVSGGGGYAASTGGLVGQVYSGLTNSYATGAVTGGDNSYVGGLVGALQPSLNNTYATGAVSGGSGAYVGGLVGQAEDSSAITTGNNYFDTDTTGTTTGVGSVYQTIDGTIGMTTAQLQGGLPGGFMAGWGTGTGLYPYLTGYYPVTPQAVTGTAYLSGGGVAVAATVASYHGGVQLGTVTSGANGYYYDLVPAGTFGSGTIALGNSLTLSGASGPSGAVFSDSVTLANNTVSQNINDGALAISTQEISYSALSSDLSATFGSSAFTALSSSLDTAMLQITASGDFTFDQSISRSGTIAVTAGNITVASGTTLTSQATGDAIALVGSGAFTNAQGANALAAPNGSWLVYSAAVAGDTFDGLNSGNLAQWNTVAGGTVSGSGDRYVFAGQELFTVTSTSDSKLYGATSDLSADYTIATPVATGVFLYDDPATLLTGAPSLTSAGTSATATVTGGPYIIDAAQGTLSGPAFASLAFASTGTLTVNPEPLTVTYTADAAGSIYGNTPAGLSGMASSSGLVNGDMLADVTSGTANWSSTASSLSSVGSYAITGAGLSSNSSNYAFTFQQAAGNAAALSVTARPLTVTADAQTSIYGSAIPTLSYVVGATDADSGLVNGETLLGALTTNGNSASNVGNYAISQGSLTASGNYTLNFTPASLTINPAPLTVTYTANTASSIYGNTAAGFSGTVSSSGLVNGDTLAGVTSGGAGWDSTASGLSSVGSYAISGVGLSANSSNYSFIFQQAAGNAAALTVTARPLTVTAEAQTSIYGGAVPALSYVVGTTDANSGLVNGDVLSGALATGGSSASNVGSYAISQGSLAASGNYTLNFTGANLTINPAMLTVTYTADMASNIYGNTPTGLSGAVSSSGLANGDTLAAVTSGTVDWSTTASGLSGVGSYAISGAGLSANSSNYSFAFQQVAGNATALSIIARPLTVTANAQTSIYGSAIPALTYAVGAHMADSGLVNGDTLSGALATAGSSTANVGTYGITQGTLAASGNYSLAYTGANLSITPAALTVTYTANTASGIYGSTPTGLSGSVSSIGLVNGDTLAAVTTGAAGWNTAASATSGVGSYAITGSGLAANSSNYNIAFAQAAGNASAYSITPAALTLTYTADNAASIYGSSPAGLSGNVSGLGFVNGEGLANLGGSVSWSTMATSASGVGSYAIGGSGYTSGNYTITANQAAANATALSISPRPLTVVADAQTSVYGSVVPSLTYAVWTPTANTGLANGDTLSGALATTGSSTSNVGTYAITQGTLTASSNYTVAYTAADLAITARSLSVVADAQTSIYGSAIPSLTYAVGTPTANTGLVNGDTLSGALATTGTSTSNVATYAITRGTLAASSNYSLNYTGANLSITPAGLTITYTANTANSVYGSANAAVSGNVSSVGLVNGDTLASVTTGTAGWNTAASVTSGVGAYAITGSGLAANTPNYNMTFAQAAGNAGAYSITPAALTLTYTANNATSIYGSSITGLSGSVSGSGFVNAEGVANLGGSVSWSTTASNTTGVGTYSIAGSGYTSGNYTITTSQAASNATALSITARPLTVTADAQTSIYGSEIPALTYTVGANGLVNGDILSGTLATTGSSVSNVGAYGITQGTLTASSNYSLTYAGANLSITPAPLTVTYTANPASSLYGSTLPGVSGSVSSTGLVNGNTLATVTTGTAAWTSAASAASGTGSYAITGSGLSANASNYSITFAQAASNATALSVSARPLTVVADAQTSIYGSAIPPLTYMIGATMADSGLVNGDALSGALATTGGSKSNPGAYAITQGTLTAGINYMIGYTGAALTIQPPKTGALAGIPGEAEALKFGFGNEIDSLWKALDWHQLPVLWSGLDDRLACLFFGCATAQLSQDSQATAANDSHQNQVRIQ